jgi:hypothetical protein
MLSDVYHCFEFQIVTSFMILLNSLNIWVSSDSDYFKYWGRKNYDMRYWTELRKEVSNIIHFVPIFHIPFNSVS